MKHRITYSLVSILLIILLLSGMAAPAAASAAERIGRSEPTDTGSYQLPEMNGVADVEAEAARPATDGSGAILIYSYEQLLLIGSNEAVEGAENGEIYSPDAEYRIAKDIALPRHTAWSLPEGFSGRITATHEDECGLYDNSTDTIYIYNPYQLAVMAADDADIQPVLTGDREASTFGMGQPVYRDEGCDAPLTYSGEHNYVISAAFSSDIGSAPISVRAKDSDLAQTAAGTPQTDGRDFAGQVIKKIDGVTYILIGNEDQLRAIGTDAEVFTAVYQTDYVAFVGHVIDTDQNGDQIILYGGDADLDEEQNGYDDFDFQQIHTRTQSGRYYVGVNQETGQPYTDATHATQTLNSLTEASWRTGEKYSIKSNYIIFRDIDLGGSARPWKPLMFNGTMYGAKTANGEKLWNGSGIGNSTELTATSAANRPIIRNVYVNQNTQIKVNDYIGIGFFATITNRSDTANIGVSGGTAVVKNIDLRDVHVENNASSAGVDQTLLNAVTSGLGTVVGGLLDVLLRVLSFGSASTDLTSTLSNLLNARAQDPTIYSTGAFAGRVYGDALIEDCRVSGTVEVSNVKDRTGGFAGYTEGMTEYSGLSQALGTVADALAAILNVIPGIGLGDLITILLDNALPVDSLIPTNYIAPILKNCEVSGLSGYIGRTDTVMAGGFVGQQIGTRIESCRVTDSEYHVRANKYGGGFTGLERDAEIKGTLDGVGIDLSSIIQRIHPQSVLIDCVIDDCAYQVSGDTFLGGFAGAMTSSYAVDCSIDCDQRDITVHGTGDYAGGFAGYATIGWQSNLGKTENHENSLLGTVRQLVTGLLSTDQSAGQKLLSLMGVSPSAILGCQIYCGELDVEADGSFAGGIVGKGEGSYLAKSDQAAYDAVGAWNSGTLREIPNNRPIILSGLGSVRAHESYAGGAAGYTGSAAFEGLLNDVVGLGDFIGFIARDITVTGVDGGYTVKADEYDAGGGFGLAVGGTIDRVVLYELKSVEADNRAAGFVGIAGPGELVGAGGLTVNLLGLDRVLAVSNLLNIGQGIEVQISDSSVTGIDSGFTVEATGSDPNNNVNEYTASGFIADSNSTKITNSHAFKLLSVTASEDHGFAGGFVGTSETGGLAEVADNDATSVKRLIEANGLVDAIGYLIPSYTNCTTNFVDGGYVEADIAGGFAADMESGTVDNSTIATVDDPDDPKWHNTISQVYDPEAVNPTGDVDKQFAVINISRVRGYTYGGGFGGRLRSGALADAGGGVSILSGITNVNIDITSLLGVMNAYVPFVRSAGVYSRSGFTVTANDIRSDDPYSGSAGGFAGYMSGAQISRSDVNQLKHTEVAPPDDLEAVNAPSYFDSSQSEYAVVGGHFAGGYVGCMDIGSAASVGNGLKILGNAIQLTNLLSALSVVVSTIEHSDVQGAGGGFSVIADATDPDDGKVGMSGGYAGAIFGGHIQNSHCKNFYYIIGQEAAGGYVGNMEPGNAANLLDDGSLLSSLVDVDAALASLVEDFVPTIRNSTTSCVPCGGAVRAHSPSDAAHQRGCAGGYCGHNEGGHIWGFNNNTWKDQNDGQVGSHNYGHNTEGNYLGAQHRCFANRIRSVYGYEYAGGYTGYMESADTADTGSIHLLGGLLSVDNVLNALSMVYPTEEHTAVYGPLRNMDMQTWNLWVRYIGRYGGYGAELAREGTVSSQAELDAKLSKYIYGTNVVAGRASDETLLITEGGDAGGYVGLMVSGVITDGQAYDTKLVRSTRSTGGYAGSMQTGAAASFGSFDLLGLVQLNLDKLVSAVQVFVPTVKSGSVHGWQSGMTVVCTGTDFEHKCGYAGGYVGSAYGAQIWGDKNAGDTAGTGCNVTNLRYVRGRNAAGGYAGIIEAASVANLNTNASKNLLQRILNVLIRSPGDLATVLQATVTTVRQVEISPDDGDFGFIVEGLSGTPPRVAGGFAGSLEAAVIGSRKGESEININGLRRVDGLYYAGGFVGLADVGGVAKVSDTGNDSTSILNLIKAGGVDLLDVFRTYIYYSDVNGVDEGFSVHAHSEDSEGLLSEVRYTGCAGGFAGGVMNGSVKHSNVTKLNTVTGLNYTGGFIGHAGKNGLADVDDAAVSSLLGLTAGVLDIFGAVIDDCDVSGTERGIVISSSGGSQPIAGGYAGYADVSQIKNSELSDLKQVKSAGIAGGFVGKTDMHYLIEVEASSPLVQLVLKIVNALVKALYIPNLEAVNLIDLDSSLIGLKLLSDGDLLYVNLFGLRIGVSLVKSADPGVTDTALITIGDSTVALPCTDQGIDMDNANAEVVVNLIKGNRTKVENCKVTGIPVGYDVYGGGADNDSDGSSANGYAGGLVGYNNEGKFTGDTMVYCDVVRGSPQKVGPFSGTTSLLSVYSFNNIASIEGDNNRYSVYRVTDLDHALTQGGQQIGGAAAQDTGTAVTFNRFDVTHLAAPLTVSDSEPYYRIFEKWKDAVMASDAAGSDAEDIDVYESDAKAVLMLDSPTRPNDLSLIPEPGESQDPCDLISLTIQKIWDDYDDFDLIRPDTIRVRIWRHQIDSSGSPILDGEGDEISELFIDSGVIPDIHPTEGWFTLNAYDHALTDSATWRRVIEGLPVSTAVNGDTIYYTYTVEEEAIEGYSTEISYSADGYTATIRNTHRPLLPFTGGAGDLIYIVFGLAVAAIGLLAFRKRPMLPNTAQRVFRPPQATPRGRPRGQPRGHPRE